MLIYIVNMYIGIFLIPSWDPFADTNVYINFLRFSMKLFGIKTWTRLHYGYQCHKIDQPMQ